MELKSKVDLVSLKEWTKDRLLGVIDRGIAIKSNEKKYEDVLKHKSLAMLFQKPSTRTRVSFEVAMTKLGGHGLYLRWEDTNFEIAGAMQDEARYLSSNVDIILARLLYHKDIRLLQKYSKVPVINGCCEKFHPCQIIADMLTIKEEFGRIEGVNVTYIGIHNNVVNSLILAAAKLKFNLCLVRVEKHLPSHDAEVEKILEESPNIKDELLLEEGIKGADILYTDSWIDMEYFNDPGFAKEKARRINKFKPYQINKELIDKTQALIMHDMPMHEGYEITRDAIESPRSIIFKQSENRLHAHKTILLELLNIIS